MAVAARPTGSPSVRPPRKLWSLSSGRGGRGVSVRVGHPAAPGPRRLASSRRAGVPGERQTCPPADRARRALGRCDRCRREFSHIDAALARGYTTDTARLLPLSVDGLIVASSLTLLTKVRARRDAPGLAYRGLILGIARTLAAERRLRHPLRAGWSPSQRVASGSVHYGYRNLRGPDAPRGGYLRTRDGRPDTGRQRAQGRACGRARNRARGRGREHSTSRARCHCPDSGIRPCSRTCIRACLEGSRADLRGRDQPWPSSVAERHRDTGEVRSRSRPNHP